MPGFFLTNSIQLSQVILWYLSLRFGMVDSFKSLEKGDQNNQNTAQGELRLCTHVKISA